MDLDGLRVALRVAEAGGFSPVAREMGVSPSTVSRTVAAVEDRLGLRLFQRSSRALSPTAEGATYLARVAPLVEQLEEARHAVRAGRVRAVGLLRLTASVAYGTTRLVPLLPVLREAAPGLEVELILTDATLDLVADGIDLAVRLAPAPEGALVSARLHDTRYRVVAAPGVAGPARPEALADRDVLRGTLPGHRDAWTFRRDGADVTVPVRGPVAISNPLALREAARRGLGPALLADWLIEADLADGRLVDLFPDHAVTATRFGTAAWLLYPSRTYLPAKVRVAIDLLRRARRAAPGAGQAGG